jgi:guanine deaminase
VELTRRFIAAAADLPGGLVQGVATPRFIPACADAALAGLGRLAAETGAAVQTHCSESDLRHAPFRARTGRSDAEALDGFGMPGPRTMPAHAPFPSDGDMDLLAARGAAVAHCPLSNAYFAGAVFPLRAAMARGVRVAAGGGAALGLPVGVFAPGMRFDALTLRLPAGPAPDAADGDARLARLPHGAQRADVAAVHVDGRLRATGGALAG